MSEQWLLQQAIAAARAGRKAEARQLLDQILQANPYNEQAWLWMSGVVETNAERVGCLQQALTLNPDNAAARKALARLQSRAGMPPPVEQPAPDVPSDHQASGPALWPIPEPPPSKRPPPAQRKPKPRLRLQGPWVVVAVLATLAMLALCLVGGGGLLYWGIFARPEPTSVQMAPMLTQTAETQSELLATHSPTPVPHTPTAPPPTSTALPAPSATPSSSPMPSPTPCAIAAAPRFDAAWRLYADQLGCALTQAHTQAAASQDFERGFLLWREDPDYVYVMHDDGRLGLYPLSVYPESVRLNPPGADPSIVPPAGLIQPVRGFGLVWRDNPEVRDGVGWAIENEARADWYYKFVVQDFAGGAILHECRMGVRVLLWDGTWFQVSSGEPCN